jgi:GR25 family glycosyltransferase involved in LPS biosynthesis
VKNFIIHLPSVSESLRTAVNLKTQLTDYGADVELFEGTYGTEAAKLMKQENRILFPWGIKGPPEVFPTKEELEKLTENYSPGIKGCFYSHYNLWKKCVELNEPIAIWEDDIVLTRPYFPVVWKDVLILALGHPSKSGKYMGYFNNPGGTPRAETYYQASMPGCCGYAIKPAAAKQLINTYSNSFLPADNAINKYHVEIEIHSYIMGMALTKVHGKVSLTRDSYWKKNGV